MSSPRREVVITGVGVFCPIGIGWEAYGRALAEGRSGVRRITLFDPAAMPVDFAGEVDAFDPKAHVRPRKSLKVMSREIQLGFAAADMAVADAELAPGTIEPERLGVVYGADMIYCDADELAAAYRACLVDGRFDFTRWGQHALPEMFPLWMLKYLPNMAASHVGIALDARGPTNSITLGDVSSLVALAEAASVIERGWADAMIAGGSSCRVHPGIWPFRDQRLLSHRRESPSQACRPFDARRDGMVLGEGAAALVLEERSHARARGAKVYGSLRGFGNTFQPQPNVAPDDGANHDPARDAAALARAIGQSLRAADCSPGDIGHVSAAGLSTIRHDRAEAHAIRATLADIPVTAPKSYFGNLGAAAAATELVAMLQTFHSGQIPATLNYEQPDPLCPIDVVHGSPRTTASRAAVLLNHSYRGQAVAAVVSRE